MSSRQHTPLILTSPDGTSQRLAPVSLRLARSGGGYDEAWIRDLVLAHPEVVPLQEVDPSFGPLIPVCKELDTREAGFADALFVNPLGMPTLVECKLWRNPEARREVVGQILDYARVLRRWTFSDMQREAARARREQGFDLFAHVRDAARLPDLDQAAFADNLTRNLGKGRLLLLVLGDGIREGVEAIAEYIQGTTGLHFTFGLVEAQVFELGDGRRIVQPRVLARTMIVNRTVTEASGPALPATNEPEAQGGGGTGPTPAQQARGEAMKAFWTDLLTGLRLDDAEQPMANALTQSAIFFSFPPRSGVWVTCYFSLKESGIGVFLGSDKTSAIAKEICNRLEADREDVARELDVPAEWTRTAEGKLSIAARRRYADLHDPAVRIEQIEWFRKVINAFVNALRPRVVAIMTSIAEAGGRMI